MLIAIELSGQGYNDIVVYFGVEQLFEDSEEIINKHHNTILNNHIVTDITSDKKTFIMTS